MLEMRYSSSSNRVYVECNLLRGDMNNHRSLIFRQYNLLVYEKDYRIPTSDAFSLYIRTPIQVNTNHLYYREHGRGRLSVPKIKYIVDSLSVVLGRGECFSY